MASIFLGLSRHLTHQFSDRTTNCQHDLLFEASERLNKAILSFKMMKSVSQKHLSPP